MARTAILQLGKFPELIQGVIDAQYRCVAVEEVEDFEAPEIKEIRALITRGRYEVSSALIEKLPNLGVIAVCGVGYDGIAVDFAKRRGVSIANTPGVLNDSVAELGIGLLLSLLREIPRLDRDVRAGGWAKGHEYPLGSTLAGRKVGVVGLGRIGKQIVRRLQAFGVDIAYFGRTDQNLSIRFYSDIVQLAHWSDVLMVVVPGGPSTAALINRDVLDALGPEGYVVNVARGSVIDEDALIDALASRRIRGAALDVYAAEPMVDPRFFALDNAILVPHIGSATTQTRTDMARLVLANLNQFFEDGTVLTPI